MKPLATKVISMIVIICILTCIPAYASNGYEISRLTPRLHVIREGNTEISTYGDITVYDTLDEDSGKRYIKTISTDGIVTEYFEDLETGLAEYYEGGKLVATYNMHDERAKLIQSYSIPEEKLKLIDEKIEEAVKNHNFEVLYTLSDFEVTNYGNGFIITPQASGRANIYPAGSVYDAYPEYTYKTIYSTSSYSSVLGRYLSMKVKDSMYSYVETSSKTINFDAGATISIIMGLAKITFGNALSIFTGFLNLVNGVYKLSQDCRYYQQQKYKYYALRQGYVYDYTYNYRDVSVLTEYGTGELSLSWDFIDDVYTNQRWVHTGQAYPFTISKETIISNAKEVWEYNMLEFGWWRWGDI